MITKNVNKIGYKYLLWTVLLLMIQRVLVQWINPLGLLLALVALWIFILHFLNGKAFYSINNIDKDCRTLMKMLIAWSLIVMFRGIFADGFPSFSDIAKYFTNAKHIMPYLMPFIAIYSYKRIDFRLFLKIARWLTVIFVIYAIFSYKELLLLNAIGLDHFAGSGLSEYTVELFEFYALLTSMVAPVVIFLMRDLVPKKDWKYACVNIIIAFLIGIIAGRRSSSFVYGLVFLASYFVVFKKRANSTIGIILLVTGIAFVLYQTGLLDFFLAKVDDDSRSGVVENFVADMDVSSWIFGRGAMGTYYDPGAIFEEIGGNRSEIETGYLNMILKGGIVYLVLYVLILWKSFCKGYFKTNNDFTKAFACMCLISCVELIPYGIQMVNFKYVALWMGVGLCLNKNIRQMSNAEIKQQFGI